MGCILAMAFTAARSRALAGEPFPGVLATLLDGWVGWDSHWYARIAVEGYFYRPGEQSSVAFFPLYPLCIHAITWLGFSPYAAGAMVSLSSGLLAIWVFHRWAQNRVTPEIARTATLLFALYPFAFYFYGVVYGDALFVLLVIAAFWALERGQLVFAVCLAGISTAARPVAPAVVLGLLARRLEWKRERGLSWAPVDALPLLTAAGFVLYMLYQAQTFGDAFAFVKTQGSPGWDQAPGLHTWLKVVWFERMFPPASAGIAVRHVVHAACAVGGLALGVLAVRSLGLGYGLYSLAVVGLPALSSKDFMGMGRYVLAAFPLFLTAAIQLQRRPRLVAPLLVTSALALLFLAAAFGADIYVS